MYTHVGRRHAPVSTAYSLPALSYATVQVFKKFGKAKYTSLACDTLDCATFDHVPPAHIIFSFASYSVTHITSNDSPSEALVFLTPSNEVLDILQGAKSAEKALLKALKSFKRELRKKSAAATGTSAVPTTAEDDEDDYLSESGALSTAESDESEDNASSDELD